MGLAAPQHVGSSWTRAQTWVPCIAGRFLTTAPAEKSLTNYFFVPPCWFPIKFCSSEKLSLPGHSNRQFLRLHASFTQHLFKVYLQLLLGTSLSGSYITGQNPSLKLILMEEMVVNQIITQVKAWLFDYGVM